MGYNKRGNPFKRGKTWIYYYYMPDGRLRYKAGNTSYAETKDEMERVTSLVKLGLFIPEVKKSVSDFLVNWYEKSCYPGLAHNSRATYSNALYN